jgi:hypothetical protein
MDHRRPRSVAGNMPLDFGYQFVGGQDQFSRGWAAGDGTGVLRNLASAPPIERSELRHGFSDYLTSKALAALKRSNFSDRNAFFIASPRAQSTVGFPMKIKRIEHIAIAVKRMAPAREIFENRRGFSLEYEEYLPQLLFGFVAERKERPRLSGRWPGRPASDKGRNL